MCVTESENRIESYFFCNPAHRCGDRFLVIVSIASEVRHHYQIYIAFGDFCLGNGSRKGDESQSRDK